MKEKIFTKRYDSKAAADIASLVEDMRQWVGEVMKQYKTTKIPRIIVGENPNDFLHNTLTIKLIIPIES